MTYARQEGDYNIVYRETLDYAFKHGEPELFRMSRRCDYDCCSRIVDMTERWYSDTEDERRERQAKIIEEFGIERCEYIMAATVRGSSRVEFSDEIRKWADGIRISDDRFVNATNAVITKLEPALDFISTVQNYKETKKVETLDITEKKETKTPDIIDMTVPKSSIAAKTEKSYLFKMGDLNCMVSANFVEEREDGCRLTLPKDENLTVVKKTPRCKGGYGIAGKISSSGFADKMNEERTAGKKDDGKGGM